MVSSRPGQRFTIEEGSVALHGLIEKKLFSPNLEKVIIIV
jgi:hypothetical protein